MTDKASPPGRSLRDSPVAATALGGQEFARLMARLGPFEPGPCVAVAVSGGADSLALAVLLADWAQGCGGSVVALTLDHGLRPESAAEARWVRRRFAELQIAQKTLRWRGPKPKSNLQAAARAARYHLLTQWCATKGLFHLALAHHRDDQAETLLLRLGRGSGLDGLAAMALVSETAEVRLLRPLLTVPKSRLEATLKDRRLDWLQDPSNQDVRFGRARLRRQMPALAREGLSAERLAVTAGQLGRVRASLEGNVSRLLARAVAIYPAGFARLDPVLLMAASEEVGLRALARVLMAIGGGEYGPRLARLERLYDHLARGLTRGRTLGGCRILPRREGILVVREAAAAARLDLAPRQREHWDGRFAVEIADQRSKNRGNLRLQALGARGWAQLVAGSPQLRASAVPPAARLGLPAFMDRDGILAVPQLNYWRGPKALQIVRKCLYSPRNGLSPKGFAPAGFTVA